MKRSQRVAVYQSSLLQKDVGKTTTTSGPDDLVEFHELPEWQKDNEFVLTGYRQQSYSLLRCTQSILRLHNETINIWTHGLGAICAIGFLVWSCRSFVPRYEHASTTDVLALAIFFSGVVVCFVLSTIFHTCSNHSKEGHRIGNQLDHLGIVVVIWASAVPSDYFGFYCKPRLQYLYWTMATLAGLSCAILTFRPIFRTPAYRPYRSGMYGLLGLSIFVPAVHGILQNGWELQNRRMALTYFLSLGLLNGTGTAIYAARVPEKWYPRTFDIYGSSHQIMHLLVICGALSHGWGLLRAFDYWQGEGTQGGGACGYAHAHAHT